MLRFWATLCVLRVQVILHGPFNPYELKCHSLTRTSKFRYESLQLLVRGFSSVRSWGAAPALPTAQPSLCHVKATLWDSLGCRSSKASFHFCPCCKSVSACCVLGTSELAGSDSRRNVASVLPKATVQCGVRRRKVVITGSTPEPSTTLQSVTASGGPDA